MSSVDQIRAKFEVPQQENVWFSTSGELREGAGWVLGTIVVFKSKIGFFTEQVDGAVQVKFDARFADTSKNMAVVTNETVMVAGKGEFRNFPMDPVNPVRVAKLLNFLWAVAHDQTPEDEAQKIYDLLLRSDEGPDNGQLSTLALQILISCIMFKDALAYLSDNCQGLKTIHDKLASTDPFEEFLILDTIEILQGAFDATIKTRENYIENPNSFPQKTAEGEVILTNHNIVLIPASQKPILIPFELVKVVYRSIHSVRIVCSVDAHNALCAPKDQINVIEYELSVKNEIRDYFSTSIVDRWLDVCRLSVADIRERVSRRLQTTMHNKQSWADQQSKLLKSTPALQVTHSSKRRRSKTRLRCSRSEPDDGLEHNFSRSVSVDVGMLQQHQQQEQDLGFEVSLSVDMTFGSPESPAGASGRFEEQLDDAVPFYVSEAVLPIQSTKKLLTHFQSLDVSCDGDIQEADLKTALSPLFKSEALPKAFFRTFDTDHNNAMSFVEFLAGVTMLLEGLGPDKLTFMFVLFDADGDGNVSRKEFLEMIGVFLELSGIPPSIVVADTTDVVGLSTALFAEIDINGDQQISLVELREALLSKKTVQTAFKRMHNNVRADILSAENTESTMLVRLGTSDWHFVIDLLDGIRKGARSTRSLSECDKLGIERKCKEKQRYIKLRPLPPQDRAQLFVYRKCDEANKCHETENVFTDYAPEIFKEIRETIYGITTQKYLESLGLNNLLLNLLTGTSNSLRQIVASRSTGQYFFGSHNGEYIVKTLSPCESKTLRNILPGYLTHLRNNPDSFLPKYYGLCSVYLDGKKIFAVIMGNVFCPRGEIKQVYDLKGPVTRRDTYERTQGVALKDVDLERTFEVGFDWHEQLHGQLEADVGFLMDNDLTNYSFLIGTDSTRRRNRDGTSLAPAGLTHGVNNHVLSSSFRAKLKTKARFLCCHCCCTRSEPVTVQRRAAHLKYKSAGQDHCTPENLSSCLKRHVISFACQKITTPSVCETSVMTKTFQQSNGGGVASFDTSETYHLGVINILHTAEPAQETEKSPVQYGTNFKANLNDVLVKTGNVTKMDATKLPDESVFTAKLESRTTVQIYVSTEKSQPGQPPRVQIFKKDAKGSPSPFAGFSLGMGKAKFTRVDEFKLDHEFSLAKPIDKKLQLEVTLRHGPSAWTKPGGKIPGCQFASQRKLVFSTLSEKERFCSLCKFVQTQKTEGSVDCGLRTLPVKIFTGTWNVGEKAPGGVEDLDPWLKHARTCELVAIASQECDYKARKQYSTCQEDWFHTLYSTLNEGLVGLERYTMIDGISMWQMRLVVFAKQRSLSKISDIHHFQEATGIANIGGNKGGVAIALKYIETPILFVGCHLAAHQGSILKRHADIDLIINGISDSIGSQRIQVTMEYHQIFWMGDLNYRIDTIEDSKGLYHGDGHGQIRLKNRHDVRDLIRQKQWGVLREHDQLKKAIAGQIGVKKLLPSFTEAGDVDVNGNAYDTPSFAPTFKVFSRFHKSNCEISLPDDYQGFEHGGTVRVPSWCDRILRSKLFTYRVERTVETLEYDSCKEIDTSDHKPVFAVFSILARRQFIFSEKHEPQQDIVIQLFNLSAQVVRAADLNGKSDPYLQVFTNLYPNAMKTDVRSNTINPVWKDNVLTIIPSISDPMHVASEYLYLSVCDRDLFGQDDVLGQSVLSLETYIGKKPLATEFCLPLYFGSGVEGRLYGTISISQHLASDVKVTSGLGSRRMELGNVNVRKLADIGCR